MKNINIFIIYLFYKKYQYIKIDKINNYKEIIQKKLLFL